MTDTISALQPLVPPLEESDYESMLEAEINPRDESCVEEKSRVTRELAWVRPVRIPIGIRNRGQSQRR